MNLLFGKNAHACLSYFIPVITSSLINRCKMNFSICLFPIIQDAYNLYVKLLLTETGTSCDTKAAAQCLATTSIPVFFSASLNREDKKAFCG